MGTYTGVSNRFHISSAGVYHQIRGMDKETFPISGRLRLEAWTGVLMSNYNLRFSLHHLILTTMRFSIEGTLFKQHTGNAFKIALDNAITITNHLTNPRFHLRFQLLFCAEIVSERDWQPVLVLVPVLWLRGNENMQKMHNLGICGGCGIEPVGGVIGDL